MGAVLSVSGAVFVLIGLGFFSVKRGLFKGEDMPILGRYVLNFALPALIFSTLTSRDLSEVLNLGYLLAYGAASVAAFAIAYLGSRRAGMTDLAASFQGMGISCANSGFIGYAIVIMVFPDVAAPALALHFIIDNLVVIPLTLFMAERASDSARGLKVLGRIFARVLMIPIVMTLIVSLILALISITPPAIIARPAEFLGNSSVAVSLFFIGGTLATLPISSFSSKVLPVVFGKLMLHPLLAALAILLVGLIGLPVGDGDMVRAMILYAGMPTVTIYPILAQRYGEAGRASVTLFAMTILSFVTLTALLWLLVPGGG
ncbi:AEC family transporter [Paracoccaceae bacterium GXU_MW_L88]